MNIKNDDAAKEKQHIEDEQASTETEILEIDEAAQSAEGLKNRDSDETEGVSEDRDQLHDTAIDVQEEDVVR